MAQERAEAQREQEPEVNLAEARTNREQEYKNVLGEERYQLFKPNLDADLDEADANEEAAAVASIYEEAVKADYDDYDAEKAFRGNTAATEEDKEMWSLWDEKLRRKRRRDWTAFVEQVQYHEDLTYGPRKDEEGKRLWSKGFFRDSETQQILWEPLVSMFILINNASDENYIRTIMKLNQI